MVVNKGLQAGQVACIAPPTVLLDFQRTAKPWKKDRCKGIITVDLFDQTIREIKDWFQHGTRSGAVRRYERSVHSDPPDHTLPEAERPSRRNQTIIFKEDTALELGHPSAGSCSGSLVTRDPSLVRDGLITHIGPDISEADREVLPFAQLIVCHYRGRDLEEVC